MRVAFLAKDFTKIGPSLIPGGCSYYRCMLPLMFSKIEGDFGLPAWTGQHGFGVQKGPEVGFKTSAVFGHDIAVLKLLMDRWVPHQIEVAQSLGQKIVIDIDDHYDGLHEDNAAFAATDPSSNKIRNREIYRKTIEMADAVVVTTPFLYDYYKDKTRRIVMIRNGVRPEQFHARRHNSNKPVIGWAGAMQWRSNDAAAASEWLQDFLDTHDLMFQHAGHMPDTAPFAEQAGIDPDRMILSPMRPLNEYHKMLDFDIGLVLLSDIPFNQAKSALKGLEYGLAGIPFIAYGTSEYKWLADQGVGRVATTPEEWTHHLTQLLDYRTRKREAAVNRSLIVKSHSIQQRSQEWDDLFASLA
jgi:glycosyltransferase involved in cell wall biosynthesis